MTRRRVAVLFGGRSRRARDLLHLRAVGDRRPRPRAHRGRSRSASREEGRWHLLTGPPPLPAESGRMPEVTDAPAPRWSSPPRAACASSSPPTAARARRRGVPGPARPHGRGRRRAGHAGARRRAVRRRRRARRRRSAWTRTSRRRCSRAPGCRSCRTRWCASRIGARTPRPSAARAPSTRATRCSRSPRRSVRASGIVKVHGPGELHAAPREAFRYARKALLEHGGEGGARDRVRRARQRRPGGVDRRRDRPDRPRVLRLRGEVPRRGRSRLRIPADLEPATCRAVQRHGRRRVPRDRRRRDGPRGLLRRRAGTGTSGSTRSTRSRGSPRSRCTRSCGGRAAWPTRS